ncbi:MAG TPA: hypothetical protein VIH47_03045 [Solirubrobacterales bacterium]
MAKRKKQRNRQKAPTFDYVDPDGNMLTLRQSLSTATIAKIGEPPTGDAASLEDAWRRRSEALFERLAVRWEIAGAPIERQRELLERFRVASPAERAWVREALREHCAENFPDVQAP